MTYLLIFSTYTFINPGPPWSCVHSNIIQITPTFWFPLAHQSRSSNSLAQWDTKKLLFISLHGSHSCVNYEKSLISNNKEGANYKDSQYNTNLSILVCSCNFWFRLPISKQRSYMDSSWDPDLLLQSNNILNYGSLIDVVHQAKLMTKVVLSSPCK